MTEPPLKVDEEVLSRLAVAGPRYTSYPTAPEWSDDYGEADALAAYARAGERADEPLSVYVHLPFCTRLCLYCGCTVEINGHQSRADSYLDAVEREVQRVSGVLGERRDVAQLHWGGGTPTFLSPAQLRRLFGMLSSVFRFESDAEISIEVDPHVTNREHVECLADLGFNRVSMGVQDLDTAVQTAVRREQTVDETCSLVENCRELGIGGLNVDLMYGLPEQTLEGFGHTLDLVGALRPDRLAVFGYAHVPWLKPAQKALEKFAMPDPTDRTRLFSLALDKLGQVDYVVVGLDHFALSDDSMVEALEAGKLHRNFMGYATKPAPDMVGFGMSAIGDVAGDFIQNARDSKTYESSLIDGKLPVVRGLRRSPEDELRRTMILSLMCRMRLDLDELEGELGRTDLGQHFAREWEELKPYAEQGFCTLGPRRLDVTPTGRLFLRHMAMVFDEYLRAKKQDSDGPRFSKTI
jgi:oxygen-independent coproporphyrinogen-3 oxidase